MMDTKGPVIPLNRIDWWTPPSHSNSFSKLIVGPDGEAKTDNIDFRVSIYQPGGAVDEHTHESSEHVWHIAKGSGIVTYDGIRYSVRTGDTIHIPAKVMHGLNNTGTEPLFLITILVPADKKFTRLHDGN